MTMFPPAATSTHHQNFISYTAENRCYVNANTTTSSSYGGGYLNQSIFGYDNFCGDHHHHQTASLVGSAYSTDQVMAEEDESKMETAKISTAQGDEEAAGSSSKDLMKDPVDDEQGGGGGWLQLSIGSHTTESSTDYNRYDDDDSENKLLQRRRQAQGRLIMQTAEEEARDHHRQQFVELDLLANSSSGGGGGGFNFTQESVIMNRQPAAAAAAASSAQQQQYYYSPVLPPRGPTNNLFLQHYSPTTATSSYYPLNPNYHNQQQVVGNYQEYNPHWPAFRSSSASSSSSSLPPVPNSYLSRLPFQLHGAPGVDFVSRFDFRVVDPPRRPHSGIWFTLQASQIQGKEPFLPQIPKSYLRIKDRQMTIRLIIKYLVNKLRLDSEAEIEIRCKGQQLLPFLTLQHVRDIIWNPRDSSSFSSDQLHHHLMVLHYGWTTAA